MLSLFLFSFLGWKEECDLVSTLASYSKHLKYTVYCYDSPMQGILIAWILPEQMLGHGEGGGGSWPVLYISILMSEVCGSWWYAGQPDCDSTINISLVILSSLPGGPRGVTSHKHSYKSVCSPFYFYNSF